MSGDTLSARRPQWDGLSGEERKAYLLETHEAAHHGAYYSTPCGGLIWRLNQTISRDCQFVTNKCRERGIEFDGIMSSREQVGDPGWRTEFLAGETRGMESRTREYIVEVAVAIEDLVRFRSTLLDKRVDREMTVGQFIDLANRVYAYLEKRCEVSFPTAWTSRLNRDEPLFAGNHEYNLNDVLECQAISVELFTLRALGDLGAFAERIASAKRLWPSVFEEALELAETEDPYGSSPYYIQVASLTAMCGAVDVIAVDAARVRYIEDEFPWFRFLRWKDGNAHLITSSIENLMAWNGQHFVSDASRWLVIYDWTRSQGVERIQQMMATLSSIGLDIQMYSMHRGSELNMRFLATALQVAFGTGRELPIEPLNPGDWMNATRLAIHIIEFDNGLLFSGLDLNGLYPKNHPIRELAVFPMMQSDVFQIMANIVNGTSARNSFAKFARRSVPKIDILRPKLRELFGEESSMSDSICDVLIAIYERGIDPAYLEGSGRYI